jgi:hypothetical protein
MEDAIPMHVLHCFDNLVHVPLHSLLWQIMLSPCIPIIMNNDIYLPLIASYIFWSISSQTRASLPVGSSLNHN